MLCLRLLVLNFPIERCWVFAQSGGISPIRRYAGAVRFSAAVLVLALVSCSQPPSRKAADEVKPDPSTEPWFAETLQELTALNREAEALVKRRQLERASELILKGQGLMARLLAVPRPPVEAVEAASDLDELYGRMLLGNRHYGWARLQFQKNVARWKNWRPQTEETARRLKRAEGLIAETDRLLGQ